ncbi:hypothetical protein ACFLTP_01585 [Chloroflexota bacterium]
MRKNGIDLQPFVAYLNDFNLSKAYRNKSISSKLLEKMSKDLFLYYIDELIEKMPQNYECPQFNILTIDEYCNILTCCVLPKDHPEYSLGNLFESSYKEIREGKLSRKICIDCLQSRIAYWVNNVFVPDYTTILENDITTLKEHKNRVRGLEDSLEEKSFQIAKISSALRAKSSQITALETQIEQM